jgi:Mg-chelatase subunit ChlD
MLKRAQAHFTNWRSSVHRRNGNALVMATLVILIMFGMLAFATDIGYLTMLKSDSYSAVDSASLAGAMALPEGKTAAEAIIKDYMAYNGIDATKLASADKGSVTIEFGTWDTKTATFTATSDEKKFEAVRVTALQTKVDSFFGRVLNKNSYSVRASSIAVKSAPLDIMLVLDLSGSMSNQGRIQALHHAAPKFVDAIESIGGDHQIGVMGFSAPSGYNPAAKGHTGRVYTASGLVQPAGSEFGVVESDLTTDFDRLRNTVLAASNMPADKYDGATGTGAAIRDATHYLKNASYIRSNATKVIVLMSDGHANKPEGSGDAYALEQATAAKGQSVAIHTIALGNGADKELLKSIAAKANGSFFDAPGSSAEQLKKVLQEAFEKVAAAASRPVIVH